MRRARCCRRRVKLDLAHISVLIGSSAYGSTDLADLPAVSSNVTGLVAALTDPIWAVSNDAAPWRIRQVFAASIALFAKTQQPPRTLLVYFAGHGLTGPRNELYLALADTDPDELAVSALPFELIRDLFGESPALNRVLILVLQP